MKHNQIVVWLLTSGARGHTFEDESLDEERGFSRRGTPFAEQVDSSSICPNLQCPANCGGTACCQQQNSDSGKNKHATPQKRTRSTFRSMEGKGFETPLVGTPTCRRWCLGPVRRCYKMVWDASNHSTVLRGELLVPQGLSGSRSRNRGWLAEL